MQAIPSVWNACRDALHTTTPTAIALFTTITIATLLITRISSSSPGGAPSIQRQDGTSQLVPRVPYWIPILGHLPNLVFNATDFFAHLRKTYPDGIFALSILGKQHSVIHTPGLTTALIHTKLENATFEETSETFLQRVFGFPTKSMTKWYAARDELMACYKTLLSEPSLGHMVDKTATKARENIVNLVSFAGSPVDEMPWERNGDIRITTNAAGEEVVEASLLPLIRDFCAHTAIPTLMGSEFLVNFPDFPTSLWTLDAGFILLATGLPRWLPIPLLTRAHIAKKRNLDWITQFEKALEKQANGQDPGTEWRNIGEEGDVGSLVMARLEVYRKHNWTCPERAAIELSLLWAANANSSPLVFWMIVRICADPDLLTKIREEFAPYIHAVQPQSDLPIAEAPRIDKLDVDGLCAHCPLLKSCYIECLRVDTASWSFKVVKQDFVLQAREKEAQAWLLRKGQYAHAGHDLHNMDPAYFPEPEVWKVERHIKYEEAEGEKRGVADMGSIRPYGEFWLCCFLFEAVVRRIYSRTSLLTTLDRRRT